MFGIGMPEMLLVLALALIVLGPKRLPDLARALGRGFSEFRRATDELKNSISVEAQVNETREQLLKEGKIQPPGAETLPNPKPEARQEEPGAAAKDEEKGSNNE